MDGGRRFGLAVAAAALWLPAPGLRAQAQGQAATTRGEIVRVDRHERGAGRLTIKHAEIKNLEMPPMTMVFHAATAEMLDGLAAGDRLRFTAERIEGRYTVTSLYRTP